MFVKSTRFKQLCQLLLSLIVAFMQTDLVTVLKAKFFGRNR